MTQRVGIIGRGRFGTTIAEAVASVDDLIAVPVDPRGVLDELREGDVAIDATTHDASERIVALALDRGVPLIVATSGWSAARIAALRVPDGGRIRFVPNFSIGAALALRLAELAAPHFAAAEVVEAHHEHKVDAPSGTARRAAERVGAAGAFSPATPDQPGRGVVIDGVPVHALRLPGLVASQSVVFGGTGETLTIRHDTAGPEAYRAGILLALRTPPPVGVTVGIDDLLGLA